MMTSMHQLLHQIGLYLSPNIYFIFIIYIFIIIYLYIQYYPIEKSLILRFYTHHNCIDILSNIVMTLEITPINGSKRCKYIHYHYFHCRFMSLALFFHPIKILYILYNFFAIYIIFI